MMITGFLDSTAGSAGSSRNVITPLHLSVQFTFGDQDFGLQVGHLLRGHRMEGFLLPDQYAINKCPPPLFRGGDGQCPLDMQI